MSVSLRAATRPDPRRYFEHIGDARRRVAEIEPVCLYLETTNRCNLLCTTCPRTFEALEPPADMSWELFTRIVDQFPSIARVVLHGVGEPMMVPTLPRMIRYLKDRGTYVLFNTNGTLLTRRKGQELIDSGLDELRVSIDAADPKAFTQVRGRDMFARIVRNVRVFRAMQRELAVERPRVSLWLTGLKETVTQLDDFVRLAHQIEVGTLQIIGVEQGLASGARGAVGVEDRLIAHIRRRRARLPQISEHAALEIDQGADDVERHDLDGGERRGGGHVRVSPEAGLARNWPGVMPQIERKCRQRWLWSKKPTSMAAMAGGTPSRKSCCAFFTRTALR